ncbi:MAG: glycoside hydrolase family 2 TIM barrel-domain containing protein [Akkermansiaceae bacterium]
MNQPHTLPKIGPRSERSPCGRLLAVVLGLVCLIPASAETEAAKPIEPLLPTLTHQPQFSTAGFYQMKGTGRDVYSMNVAWRFLKGDAPNAESPAFDDSKWGVVCLPHGLEYLPIDASGGVNYQGPAWYRKHFTPDPALKGRKLFLHFEAIMGKCKVWVNGTLVTEHFGGYLPVIADVSSHLKWGRENVIAVYADNCDDPLYPPGKPQSALDFTYFGGIYRDCWLVAHGKVFITDPNYENEVAGGGILISYDNVSERSAEVNLRLHLRNDQASDFAGSVDYTLADKAGGVVQKVSAVASVPKGAAASVVARMNLVAPNLWSPESPYLYQLQVMVKDRSGRVVDGYVQRIGIRGIEFRQADGLWLNGKPYPSAMIGANRHQDFAVVGHALPNSMHWRDAKKLRDAGMTVIRTGHCPSDPAFMDACDELGLFVVTNTPGWQFWNSKPLFGTRVYSDIRHVVRQNRNHASLFFWEPVLNETSYPADFAKKAAQAVAEEFPYPYSTSSCDDGSEGAQYFPILLRPRGKLDPAKTYFVREWGDNTDDWNAQNSNSRVNRGWGEAAMLVQAGHYGQADGFLETLYRNPRQVVGGTFWHSFDHQRGYHPMPFLGGIMDAFRQPKYAYYMFQAQRSPVKSDLIANTGPMVFIAHEMTPFSSEDVTVYSNCDEVRLTFLKDGKPQIYRRNPTRKGMPAPIITFKKAFDYMACKTKARAKKQAEVYLLAEGLIGGKVVATHKVVPSGRPEKVVLWLDGEGVDLVANGSDVVTVVAGIADKEGNIKRLTNEQVQFTIEGEGRLLGGSDVGVNPRPVLWGTAPMCIQSNTTPGRIKVTANVLFAGLERPMSGELVTHSVASGMPAIYSLKDLARIDDKGAGTAVLQTHDKSDLEQELQRLRRELNDLKLKEVEKQQSTFGEGIN